MQAPCQSAQSNPQHLFKIQPQLTEQTMKQQHHHVEEVTYLPSLCSFLLSLHVQYSQHKYIQPSLIVAECCPSLFQVLGQCVFFFVCAFFVCLLCCSIGCVTNAPKQSPFLGAELATFIFLLVLHFLAVWGTINN